MASREEIQRLSALVGATGVMPPGGNVPSSGAVNGVNVKGGGSVTNVNGMSNGQMVSVPSVSMAVSLPQNGKPAAAVVGGGRGYGY